MVHWALNIRVRGVEASPEKMTLLPVVMFHAMPPPARWAQKIPMIRCLDSMFMIRAGVYW
eukprot:9481305-Pyramimonas_sp.AAC.1